MIFNSVSFPRLSYKNTFLFIFLSCCVGNLHCEELEKDRNENIQKFDERKQRELDSLRSFYEQQQNSVAHKVRDEPPPKSEQNSTILVLYNFVTEHYIISLVLAIVFLKSISHSLLLALSIFKERLHKIFNSLPKPFQRFLRKERRKFQEIWDYIMQNKDGIL